MGSGWHAVIGPEKGAVTATDDIGATRGNLTIHHGRAVGHSDIHHPITIDVTGHGKGGSELYSESLARHGEVGIQGKVWRFSGYHCSGGFGPCGTGSQKERAEHAGKDSGVYEHFHDSESEVCGYPG